VVTDNASVNIAAAKRPSIFWNGGEAHCLDLMLEDIGKLEPRQQGSFGHDIAIMTGGIRTSIHVKIVKLM
jgi:hypothetical protein